ncbi:hypothetical protein D9756_010812 [Leucocoprinus leucothites]|uniref:Uncharacterized protein n=1 Tax=Leucocoprinus leucothites TaxID=201217 RepID=A0A8H5CQQ4_9AGAR|nr:hypothetical protein D9756_010812 [Leucoagaricus leucothites]
MRSFVSLVSVCIFLTASVGASPVNTVTVYDVDINAGGGPNPLKGVSTSVSPIGVGADGKTTYIEAAVFTYAIPDATTTVQTTQTATATLVEDSKGLTENVSVMIDDQPVMASASCSFDGTTKADCAAVFAVGSQTLGPTSLSGALVPIYTAVSAAHRQRDGGFWGLTGVAGVVTGAIMVLGM